MVQHHDIFWLFEIVMLSLSLSFFRWWLCITFLLWLWYQRVQVVVVCDALCVFMFTFFVFFVDGTRWQLQSAVMNTSCWILCMLPFVLLLYFGRGLSVHSFVLSPCLFDAERRGEVQMWTKKEKVECIEGVHEWIENWKIKWYRVCLQYFCVAVWSVDIHFPSQSTHHLSPHLFCLSLFFLSISFSLCLFCQFWWATSCAAGSCRECPVDSIVLRRIDSIHFRPGTCCDSDCLVLWITPLFAKSNLVYPMPVQPVLALFQCLISMRHSPVSIDFILSFIADSNLSLFSWSMMSTKPKHRYVLIAWMSRVRF